jgi:hypothetical protein
MTGVLTIPQAGGKEDGAQGVGVNVDKVEEALKLAQTLYTDKMGI